MIFTHLREVSARRPAEVRKGSGCIGITYSGIARAARGEFVGDGVASSGTEGCYDFQNRCSFARSQIPAKGPSPALQIVQSRDMPAGKIHDVDIVPDTGPVRRRIVVAEYPDFLATSDCDLRNEWQQIVGCSLWIFANPSRFMGTDWVEISK